MECLDYHLQHVLRRMLEELPYEEREGRLKSVYLCGRTIIKNPGFFNGVYVLSNGNQAKFFGQSHCQNPFICPVCSARIMEKNRARIASALDMLHEEYFGFMVTFTLPHLKFMSCREITDILYDTWKYFRLKIRKDPKKNYEHPYTKFARTCEVKHFVRVCEYTYGDENGWHPHFHTIFWCSRDKADLVPSFQKELNDFWTTQGKRVALKYWKANKLHEGEDLNDIAERLFSTVNDKYPALKISTDENGKLIETTSSGYIAGWGSDREVTGNIRKEASHENHFTPYQILAKAEHSKHWKNIYIDFVRAVTRKPVHHRLNFSKTGISKMIDEWQKVNGYDSTSKQKKSAEWRVVTYFTEEQWSDLCYLNRFAPVLANILCLAAISTDLMFEYIDSLEVRRREIQESRRADVERIWAAQCLHVESIFNVA